MGITASVRLQYWQDNVQRTRSSDPHLYPTGTDVLTTVNVDASRFDALVDAAKAIGHAAEAIASTAAGSPLGVLFSGAQLAQSVTDVRRALADHVGVAGTLSAVTFPHPRYNRIRLLFNADSGEDALSEVGHAPPASSHTHGIQYAAGNGDAFHRSAEFWMDLDALRQSLDDRVFFGHFPFAFGVRETDAIVTDLSVAANIHVFVIRLLEAAPVATTDVIYFRNVGQEFPVVVARKRLVEFVPRIGGMSEGRGEPLTNANLALKFENGAFRVNDAPFDLVQLLFNVESSRKVVAGRPRIEVDGGVHPDNAGGALVTSVTQPIPVPAFDSASGDYLVEGMGTASIMFEPAKVPLGRPYTVVFSATQLPGGWQSVQQVRLIRSLGGFLVDPHAGRIHEPA